jgi:gas vesicle protein
MTTEDRDSGNGLGGVLFAFIAGAAVGAATALMLAPASGRETRARVQGAARDATEKARRGVQEIKGTVGESWQRAVDAAKDAFEAALQRD